MFALADLRTGRAVGGGQRIRKGDLVALGLAAANTDPQVRPDAYAAAMGNHAHMSFSHGEHGCPFPTQEIARILTATGIEALLDRLPEVALAVKPNELVGRPRSGRAAWRTSPGTDPSQERRTAEPARTRAVQTPRRA
jgi:cytochrome P450